MNTILLVGIPGSGKSSILQETVRQIPAISVVNYGDQMLEEAAVEGISRDFLRKMPFHEQRQIGIKAARKIVQQKTHQTAIIDTHALIRTNVGYCPGLPLEVLEILSPKACAWIDCLPSVILQRRVQDQIRVRDAETEEELTMHQELTRSFLTACCMYTGALLCRIPNTTSSIHHNVMPLIQLIRSIASS